MSKVRLGLYARVAISVTLLVTLTMFVLGFYLVSDANDKLNKERLQQVSVSAKMLANGSRDALISEDFELLEFWLNSVMLSEYYAYAYYTKADGKILAHTDAQMVAKKQPALGELKQVLKRNVLYQERPVMEVVYPVRLESYHLANVHVGYFLDQATFIDSKNLSRIIVLVFVLLGSLLLSILFIVRRQTIPISTLTHYVTSLSLTDIKNKLDVGLLKNKTEVGDLARAFEGMTLRLIETFDELKNKREHLEEMVEERTRELSQANGELKAFSYSVSHDLRTPLHVIEGYIQILEQDFSEVLTEKGSIYVQRIHDATMKMNVLIEDMLLLSQVSQKDLKRDTVEIGLLARDIAKNLKATDSQRDIKFIINEDLKVEADIGLLRIVLNNLFGNALKYTGKCEHAVIEFDAKHEGSEQIFYLRDNGAGFDMKYADKLFSAFKRLHSDDEFEGSGVGLATVERIIHRHGGRIWAEAEPDKGAVFFFTLTPSS